MQEAQQRIAELTADAEENVSGRPRRQGVRPGGPPARALRALGPAGVRPADVRDADPGVLRPDDQLPAQPRPGHDPPVRRPRGDRRDAQPRRVHRLLRLPADADLADADARLHARRRAARDRLGRADLPDPRPRAADDVSPADAPALPDGGGRVTLRDVGPDLRGRATVRRCATSTSTSPAGHTVALVGAMGSGKSALVSLLPRLYDVDHGRGRDRRRRRPLGRPGQPAPARSRSSTTTRSCSRPPCTTTSPTRGPTPPRGGGARRRRGAGRRLHRAAARGYDTLRRRARADAVRRPAPADRDRPGDPRRSADPDPRRRDLLGRRLDRAGDQARAAAS